MNANATHHLLRLAVLACAAAVPPLGAQVAVSPADRVFFEGSTSTIYPLGRARARVQQLIGDMPAQTVTIVGHAYRRDATNVRGVVNAFRSEISVIVSISPRTPSNASSTFADNHGTPVAVLNRSWVNFPQTDRPTSEPAPTFELRIPWTTPFPYAGTGTLCLETVVHGNDVGGQPDRNFSVFQDGHDLSRTSSRQPGYRFGLGCAAQGTTTRANATMELIRTATSLDLEVRARAGMPGASGNPALSVLLLGTSAVQWGWPSRPECTALVAPLATVVLGENDGSGNLDVTLRGLGMAQPGRSLIAQVLSLQPSTMAGTLSDGSILTIPNPPPSELLNVRIANGDDSSAATGTVSFSVPVVELF